jgi:hypothetical protein
VVTAWRTDRANRAWDVTGRWSASRYHAFLTDTALSTVDTDVTHRAHAVVEQVFAGLIDGPKP